MTTCSRAGGVDFKERGFTVHAVDGTEEERRHRVRTTADIGAHLTEDQQTQMRDLLERMWMVFSNKPGNSTITSLHIDTGDAAPVANRPYRNPMSARAGFLKQLEEWEEEGIIRRSKSAWAAPVLLVPKKDGTWRTVVDYRGLNKLLKREHNPVPLISEVMDTMGGRISSPPWT
jgi:hypothetical protein